MVKNLPAKAGDTGDMGLLPGLGTSLEEGNGTPPQFSCLENSMDREAWRATIHEVTELDMIGQASVCTHTLSHMYASSSQTLVYIRIT